MVVMGLFCYSGSIMELILVVFFHGKEENGLLECSHLSKWDTNEQKELEVIQEVDEGEVQGVRGEKFEMGM